MALNTESEKLKKAIYEKFANFDELGKVLGVTKSTISGRVKKPSSKFLKQLEKLGINVEDVISGGNTIIGSDQEVNILEDRIKDKDEIIYQLKQQIELLKEQLQLYKSKLK